MFVPVRLVRGWLPAALENVVKRFVWTDPQVLLDADVSSNDFRLAMNAIHVGGTYKITGANRHPEADDLLIEHVDTSKAEIVDIGASDGSTSLDLIRRLAHFRSYVIADLFLTVEAQRYRGRVFFYDPSGTCILVAGRLLLSWPAMSTLVRFLYGPLIGSASSNTTSRVKVVLLNPEVRALMESDPRVTSRVHDVFGAWRGARPDVIKVANLLRRLYFTDGDIGRALTAIHGSLADNGHLLIVDNAREKGIGTRAGLYRRTSEGFALVSQTPDVPEIGGLVLAARQPVS